MHTGNVTPEAMHRQILHDNMNHISDCCLCLLLLHIHMSHLKHDASAASNN